MHTHMHLAVRSAANNSDAWGWEQVLWFGMGQKLRMGEWKPGDPLPASLREMLDYFKLKRVRPVAYVYPILAFLAHTLPGGQSPEWIVNGTYMYSRMLGTPGAVLGTAAPPLPSSIAASHQTAFTPDVARGPLRSSIANEAFQEWLPHTLLAFANATGAGGFSFDYTYIYIYIYMYIYRWVLV